MGCIHLIEQRDQHLRCHEIRAASQRFDILGKGACTSIADGRQSTLQIGQATVDHVRIDGKAGILGREQPEEHIGGQVDAAGIIVEPAPTAIAMLEAIDLLQALRNNLRKVFRLGVGQPQVGISFGGDSAR